MIDFSGIIIAIFSFFDFSGVINDVFNFSSNDSLVTSIFFSATYIAGLMMIGVIFTGKGKSAITPDSNN